MTDPTTARTPGPGWWIASDGKLYPPEEHPDARDRNAQTGDARGGTAQAAVETEDNAFGDSLSWAFTALRANLRQLALVTLLATAVLLLGGVLLVGMNALGARTERPSLTLAASLIGTVLQVAATAWVMLAMAGAWRRTAANEVVTLDVFVPNGLATFLLTYLFVAPVQVLSGGLAAAFALIALLLALRPSATPGAALGRMLGLTCGSARRFFQTLLIGLLFALFTFAISFLVATVLVQASSSVALSSFGSAFNDTDSSLRSAEEQLTLVGGFVIAVAIAVTCGFAIWNLFGLWVAGYLRRVDR